MSKGRCGALLTLIALVVTGKMCAKIPRRSTMSGLVLEFVGVGALSGRARAFHLPSVYHQLRDILGDPVSLSAPMNITNFLKELCR